MNTFYSSLLKITALKFNFSIEFINVDKNFAPASYNMILKKLRNNELDLHILRLPSVYDGNFSYSGAGADSGSFSAMVPIVSTNKLIVPEDSITYLFIIPAVVAIRIYGAHAVNIQKENWSAFYLIQVIFGMPVEKYIHEDYPRGLFS